MAELRAYLDAHPETKLLSKSKLSAYLKKVGVSFTSKELTDALKGSEILQVTKRVVKPTNPLKITADPDSYQIDVVFLPKYKRENGCDSFLLCVEIGSRKAFAYPLPSNRLEDLLDQYVAFLLQIGLDIVNITGDDQFNKYAFRMLNDDLSINTYTNISKEEHISKYGNRLGTLDACVRTLRNMIRRYMLAHDDVMWREWLYKIVALYNETPNIGIGGKTPNEVYPDVDFKSAQHKQLTEHNFRAKRKEAFKPGDTVRIYLGRGKLQKAGINFSRELYTVSRQEGFRYKVKGDDGKLLRRNFDAHELQKVDVRDLVKARDGTNVASAEKENRQARTLKQAGIIDDVREPINQTPIKTARVRKVPQKLRE